MATAVFFAILMFGAFEWLSANFTIAAYLTLPLLPLVFFFKNTYQIKSDHIAVSTFGKTHKKIWLRDIEKLEEGKTLYGKKMVKVFYSPYDYMSVALGEQTSNFIQELKVATKAVKV